ncbi:MAG TPA: ABC transporter ATP-binding protein [Gemmataceae bacterium]|nr:ABC transporter ATP-binding protein [Gemmataceae bacterium]
MPPVIRVEQIGKCYRLNHARPRGDYSYGSLREDLMKVLRSPLRRFTGGGPAQGGEEFWALKDVGFELQAGETLGIVGRNGAGKSTLLKILSRITKPTIGEIELRGRVGSLLEVGTGFHPELTGRENIYLNGAILGMKRAEITRKFDEIVAFAEVEKFLDTPVKHYSSGMYVRLAFAVAAHLEPEILIVDEVLAVGDVEFQRKCMNKMGDVAGQGRTVLFVSHNMGAVQTLCKRAVLLESGQVKQIGTSRDVITEYLKAGDAALHTPLTERHDRRGKGRFRFADLTLLDSEGQPCAYAVTGEDCYLRLSLSVSDPDAAMMSPLDVAVIIRDGQGQKLTEVSTWFTGSSPRTVAAARELYCQVPHLPLLAGQYRIDLWCGSAGQKEDVITDAAVLRVEPGNYFRNYEDARTPRAEKHGCIMIPQRWHTLPPLSTPS